VTSDITGDKDQRDSYYWSELREKGSGSTQVKPDICSGAFY
jgi:hypothetical protein